MIDREFRRTGARHGGDHLGAVAGDPALSYAADHEAGDVLQEQGGRPLVAQLDEMRALLADSENRTPLLATMPTGWPWMRAKPVTSVGP